MESLANLSKPLATSRSESATLSASDLGRRYCSPLVVARCVEILIGCYRKGEADNPEVYTTALAAILEGYPESVVRFVTDPRTGLPGRSNWLPTIAEARGACETAMKIALIAIANVNQTVRFIPGLIRRQLPRYSVRQ